MENVFTNVFFQKEDAEFIDNFRANVQLLDNQYKQSLALAVMNRSLTRKITMGHFGHTKALDYASDPVRIKRNRSLIRPVKDLFLDILPQYNQAVFDNGQDNRSYNENILDLFDLRGSENNCRIQENDDFVQICDKQFLKIGSIHTNVLYENAWKLNLSEMNIFGYNSKFIYRPNLILFDKTNNFKITLIKYKENKLLIK